MEMDKEDVINKFYEVYQIEPFETIKGWIYNSTIATPTKRLQKRIDYCINNKIPYKTEETPGLVEITTLRYPEITSSILIEFEKLLLEKVVLIVQTYDKTRSSDNWKITLEELYGKHTFWGDTKREVIMKALIFYNDSLLHQVQAILFKYKREELA